AAQLAQAASTQQNVRISGGTGTGKTTLLNALAALIPSADRIVVIEETAEIHLDKPNVLRLEARRAQAPLGQEAPLPPVTIADLLRAALRHRPDRILVGEVRGAEAFHLLQALNTGHLGSLSTIHANSTAPQPATPVTGAVTWTFEVVPQTNLQTFRTTIQSQNTWLPITLTMSTAMIPGNTPPAQISTQGEYDSPRGCRGTFASF